MHHKQIEQKIKVVIIDDHQLFREGVKRILGFEERIEILAEGENGLEAIELVEQHKPDVVIMDINMPGINGIEATRKLAFSWPDIKVLILSIHDHEKYVTNALQSGALGYLLKEMAAENLVQAVKVVAGGGSYLHPRVTHKLLAEYRRLSEPGSFLKEAQHSSGRRPLHLLTRRESEVLQLLADGKSNRSLGEALYISEKTVKNHVSNILQKMGVTDRTQAVVTAIKKGWVEVR